MVWKGFNKLTAVFLAATVFTQSIGVAGADALAAQADSLSVQGKVQADSLSATYTAQSDSISAACSAVYDAAPQNTLGTTSQSGYSVERFATNYTNVSAGYTAPVYSGEPIVYDIYNSNFALE